MCYSLTFHISVTHISQQWWLISPGQLAPVLCLSVLPSVWATEHCAASSGPRPLASQLLYHPHPFRATYLPFVKLALHRTYFSVCVLLTAFLWPFYKVLLFYVTLISLIYGSTWWLLIRTTAYFCHPNMIRLTSILLWRSHKCWTQG